MPSKPITRIPAKNQGVFKAPGLALMLLLNLLALGFCQDNVQSDSKNKQKDQFNGRIKVLGGRILLDGAVESSQAHKFDHQAAFVGISTPTTPGTNHANLWLNNSLHQLCTNFDDGSQACLATGASTIGYLTESSATATYLQTSSATATYLQSSSATATYFQSSSATATYLQSSSATATYGQLKGTQTWSGGNTFSSATYTAAPRIATLTSTILATDAAGTLISTTVAAGIASGSTTTWTGTNIFDGSTTIKGTTLGTNAPVGYYDEYISSTSSGGRNFPTTGQFGDLLSVTLTAGDYNINICINTTANGATVTAVLFGLGTVTGNDSSGLTTGDTSLNLLPPTSASDNGGCISAIRSNSSGSTTYYLKYFASYSVATPQAKGSIKVRRAR